MSREREEEEGERDFFLSSFIYFERERESMSRGGAEREGERVPSRL